MNYNQQLQNLYASKLQDLKELFSKLNNSDSDTDKDFSWPLLLYVWEEDYAKANVKLMVFGQETYGWNSPVPRIEDNDIHSLISTYISHELGHGRDDKRSNFWPFVYKLNRAFGNNDTNCFIWNNILKFGKEDTPGRPSQNVTQAEIMHFNVIAEEISILHPDVCIFLTGPDYDEDIKKKFGDVEFISVEGYDHRQFARLKSRYLPKNSFRTYHPGYGNRISGLYQDIMNKIIELCK